MFDPVKFDIAVAERNEKWIKTDDILYRICREMPRHNDLGEVTAKLTIIGRSYSTGIERAIRSKHTQGSSVECLANYIWSNAGEVDKQLSRTCSFDCSHAEHFREAVDVHGRLVKMLNSICTRSPRSFVSKYMHFHCPFVPIYDSYAQSGLSQAIRWRQTLEGAFESPKSADGPYYRFCIRFWTLYREAIQVRPHALVKELDRYLCYLAKDKVKAAPLVK
jgi:hypothetical protein